MEFRVHVYLNGRDVYLCKRWVPVEGKYAYMEGRVCVTMEGKDVYLWKEEMRSTYIA